MVTTTTLVDGVAPDVLDNHSKVAHSLKGELSTGAEIVTPGSPDYEASIVRWSDSCIKRAAAVINVASAQDVAAVLKYIKAEKIPFAVHGGGHSTSGASACEDGIVIDLRKLRSVVVDPEAKSITVGGGCTWKDVDEEAFKYGLATVGGTVNHTGVGGLTLGGGYGWLSGMYGLTVDNLLSVEIVLHDGSIKRASETENADLFWAVRGAGTSFGVVTEFVYRGHEQKNTCFGGIMVFTPDKLAGVVAAGNRVIERDDGRAGLALLISAPPPVGAPMLLCATFLNGSEEEGREFFKPLFDLEPVMNHTGSMPYDQVNAMVLQGATYGGRKIFGGSVFQCPLQADVVAEVFADFAKFVAQHERVNESMVIFEFIPYDKINEVPHDAMAFASRGKYCNVGTCWKWYDPAQDGMIRQHNREVSAKLRELFYSKTPGKDDGVGMYTNYVSQDIKAREIFGNNLEKLKELKSKYDPGNLFNKSSIRFDIV